MKKLDGITIRIGDVEFSRGEFRLYYPNEFYGKRDEYEDAGNGMYRKKDGVPGCRCYVTKSCFDEEESSCTLMRAEGDPGDPDFRTVGFRPWDMDEKDERDLAAVVKLVKNYMDRRTTEE